MVPNIAHSSPVYVGTIGAIRRDFFTEIGEFDDGMMGWGGENVDLSIRVRLLTLIN